MWLVKQALKLFALFSCFISHLPYTQYDYVRNYFYDYRICYPEDSDHVDMNSNLCNFKDDKMWPDLRKPAQMAQELKSKLQPDINDTLMHYLET